MLLDRTDPSDLNAEVFSCLQLNASTFFRASQTTSEHYGESYARLRNALEIPVCPGGAATASHT